MVTTPPAPTEQAGAPPSTLTGGPEREPEPVEIEIEEGEIESGRGRVRAQNGRVRLQIRSDQALIVEAEDHELSVPILAGADRVVEFDTFSAKDFELELRRHKGVLVLRLDD